MTARQPVPPGAAARLGMRGSVWEAIAEGGPLLVSDSTSEHHLRSRTESFYNRKAKRALSVALALPLVVVTSPVIVAVSIAVFVDSGLPIFYRAERGGYRGSRFNIIKFRTMVKNADLIGGGTTALNDSRITRVGELLRKTKIDEFPQLVNILRGEMCFVGPRPELPRYVEQYDGLERYILEVRPGITDFSSLRFIALDVVVGEEDADAAYEALVLKEKNALRLRYVAEMSCTTDVRIFAATVTKSLRQGASHLLRRGHE